MDPIAVPEPPGGKDVCRKITLFITCGVIGLLLVLIHEFLIMQLLILCYTVVLSSIWLLPYYSCNISVPTSVLWVIMYLVTSNSFEFHLFIEIMPNVALDMIKFLKRKARFLVIKVPKYIFTAILVIAFSQFHAQYWSVKKGFLDMALRMNATEKVDITSGLEPVMDWSVYIFTGSFFMIIYIVPLGSDWVYYRRKAKEYSAKIRLAYFRNLFVCILHELRLVYCTPRTPLFLFLFPATCFLYRVVDSPVYFFGISMILGFVFTCICGSHKAYDPTFKPSPYTLENCIYARHFLLQYVYFPLILFYYLKSGPANIFGFELSIIHDFVLYVFIIYLTLCQTVRVCTSKLRINPNAIRLPEQLEMDILEPQSQAGPSPMKILQRDVEALNDGEGPAALVLG